VHNEARLEMFVKNGVGAEVLHKLLESGTLYLFTTLFVLRPINKTDLRS